MVPVLTARFSAIIHHDLIVKSPAAGVEVALPVNAFGIVGGFFSPQRNIKPTAFWSQNNKCLVHGVVHLDHGSGPSPIGRFLLVPSGQPQRSFQLRPPYTAVLIQNLIASIFLHSSLYAFCEGLPSKVAASRLVTRPTSVGFIIPYPSIGGCLPG